MGKPSNFLFWKEEKNLYNPRLLKPKTAEGRCLHLPTPALLWSSHVIPPQTASSRGEQIANNGWNARVVMSPIGLLWGIHCWLSLLLPEANYVTSPEHPENRQV